MKTKTAVLHEAGRPRPYATSLPLAIEELDITPVGPGEVIVRMTSAGLCHSDLSVMDGVLPRGLPVAFGHEAAGIVEEIGAGVTLVKPGDSVVFAFVPSCGQCTMCMSGRPCLCVPGNAANRRGELLHGGVHFHKDGKPVYHHLGVTAFSEYTICAQESLVPIPSDVPSKYASMFGCAALTGLGAVFNAADVRPGSTVAIFGAGGVGLMALLGALCVGASAIVVDPLASKRALAMELGATLAIDPAEGEPAAQIADRLGIPGADNAIEAVGIAAVSAQAVAATAPGGTTVLVGIARPTETFAFAPTPLVWSERTIKGSFMGSSIPRRDIPRYINLWRAGKLPIEKLLGDTVTLDGLNAGFDRLAAGEVVRSICVFD